MGKMKKLFSVLLALCMLVLPASGVLAAADYQPEGSPESYVYFSSDEAVTVKEGQQYYIDSKITTDDPVYATLITDTVQDMYVCVTNASTNKIITDGIIDGGDPDFWSEDDNAYYVGLSLPKSLKGTKVRVAFTFRGAAQVMGMLSTNYTEGIAKGNAKEGTAATEMDAYISRTSEKLTVGFTTTLKVNGYSGKVKWSSNKTNIATVNSKGKVTGKKNGSCKITATLESGTTFTCKVKVYKNVYTDTVSRTPGSCVVGVTKLQFASNGDLKINYQVVNGTVYSVTKLTGLKIKIYDKNGKLIGTFSQSTVNCNIGANGKATLSGTIKKSQLKKKTADLRLISDIDFDGEYYYRY